MCVCVHICLPEIALEQLGATLTLTSAATPRSAISSRRAERQAATVVDVETEISHSPQLQHCFQVFTPNCSTLLLFQVGVDSLSVSSSLSLSLVA